MFKFEIWSFLKNDIFFHEDAQLSEINTFARFCAFFGYNLANFDPIHSVVKVRLLSFFEMKWSSCQISKSASAGIRTHNLMHTMHESYRYTTSARWAHIRIILFI